MALCEIQGLTMRLTIRDAIVAAILPIAGIGEVRAGRADDLEESSEPVVDVRLGPSAREQHNIDGGFRYTQQYIVRVVAHGSGDLDAALSNTVDSIEASLSAMAMPGLLSMDLTDLDFELSEERPRGEATLAYLADYTTQ